MMVLRYSGSYLKQELGKSLKNWLNLRQTKDRCDHFKKKIDEHEFVIAKMQKRTANFDELSKKIAENETERKILESKMNQEFGNLKNIAELTKDKVRIEKSINHIQVEIKRYQESMIEYKEKMNIQISKIHEDLSTQISEAKLKIQGFADSEKSFSQKISYFNEELKKQNISTETERIYSKQQLEKVTKKFNQFEQKQREAESNVEEMGKALSQRMIEISRDFRSLDKSFKETDQYLNMYLPVKIMNYHSEILNESLKGASLNKFIKYQQEKYQQLEEIIKQEDKSLIFDKRAYTIPPIPELVDETVDIQQVGQPQVIYQYIERDPQIPNQQSQTLNHVRSSQKTIVTKNSSPKSTPHNQMQLQEQTPVSQQRIDTTEAVEEVKVELTEEQKKQQLQLRLDQEKEQNLKNISMMENMSQQLMQQLQESSIRESSRQSRRVTKRDSISKVQRKQNNEILEEDRQLIMDKSVSSIQHSNKGSIRDDEQSDKKVEGKKSQIQLSNKDLSKNASSKEMSKSKNRSASQLNPSLSNNLLQKNESSSSKINLIPNGSGSRIVEEQYNEDSESDASQSHSSQKKRSKKKRARNSSSDREVIAAFDDKKFDIRFEEKFEEKIKFCREQWQEEDNENIKTIANDLIDDALNELNEQLEDRFESLEKKFIVFNQLIEVQNKQVEQKQLDNFKSIMDEINDFKQVVAAEINRRERKKNDFAMDLNKMFSDFELLNNNFKAFEEQQKLVGESIACLVEGQLIQIALDFQEEHDKEYNFQIKLSRAVALYGQEHAGYQNTGDHDQHKNKGKFPHIDNLMKNKQDGHHIVKNFKMACLAYKSSDINYRGTSIKRKHLLNLKNQMIEQLIQKLCTQELYQALINQKSFDDFYIQKQNLQINMPLMKRPNNNKQLSRVDTNKINNSFSYDEFHQKQEILEAMTQGVINENNSYQLDLKKKELSQTRNFKKDPYDMMSLKISTQKMQIPQINQPSNLSTSRFGHETGDGLLSGNGTKGFTGYGGFGQQANAYKKRVMEDRSSSVAFNYPKGHQTQKAFNQRHQSVINVTTEQTEPLTAKGLTIARGDSRSPLRPLYHGNKRNSTFDQ